MIDSFDEPLRRRPFAAAAALPLGPPLAPCSPRLCLLPPFPDTCCFQSQFLDAAACTGPRVAWAQSACAAQLSAAALAAGSFVPTVFVDPDTPADACTKPMCTGSYAECDVTSPPTEDLQLVFSDEFEEAGRQFGVGEGDPRWTADRMWYAGMPERLKEKRVHRVCSGSSVAAR